MKHQERSLYPATLAIVIVGLLAFGVPASTLVYAVFVVTCPLMMIFLYRSSGRHWSPQTDRSAEGHGQHIAADRW